MNPLKVWKHNIDFMKKGGYELVQRDIQQYKVTKGTIKDSGISATYEYTTGNKTSKRNTNNKGDMKNEG